MIAVRILFIKKNLSVGIKELFKDIVKTIANETINRMFLKFRLSNKANALLLFPLMNSRAEQIPLFPPLSPLINGTIMFVYFLFYG